MSDNAIGARGGLPRYLLRPTRQVIRAANQIQAAFKGWSTRNTYGKIPGGFSGAAAVAGLSAAAKYASKSKSGVRSSLSVNGTSAGKAIVRKKRKGRRKQPKTLKKRIAALEKNRPPKSYYMAKDFLPYKLTCAATNTSRWYEIPLVDHNMIEAKIDALPKVSGSENYLTANTSVQIKNIYQVFRMKNTTTGNIHVEYQPYICIDDDGESVLDNIREGMINRGYTFANSVQAATAASATTAQIPRRLDCASTSTANEVHYSPWGVYEVSRKWKKLANVTKLIVGPGDTLEIKIPHKGFQYKPEVLDDEAFTYLKRDMSLVIKTLGELSHQKTTNISLVGYGEHYFDCVLYRGFTVVYDSGEGLKTVEYTDSFDNTNLTDAVHVDNMASAIEEDKQS
jgi:hypothetical protein